MKSPIMTAFALGLASLALAQMSVPADARPRHKGTKMMRNSGSTGGAKASSSAVGGNANQPSKPGAQGSGGGGM